MSTELKLIVNNKEEEKDINYMADNVTLMTAGTGTDDTSWLAKLPVGTIFLISDMKSADFNLGHFKLLERTDKGNCILVSSISQQPIFVNPGRFCQKYAMAENLGIFIEQDVIEEDENKVTETEENS